MSNSFVSAIRQVETQMSGFQKTHDLLLAKNHEIQMSMSQMHDLMMNLSKSQTTSSVDTQSDVIERVRTSRLRFQFSQETEKNCGIVEYFEEILVIRSSENLRIHHCRCTVLVLVDQRKESQVESVWKTRQIQG